ncbi:MAG: alpha/beta fold hydrolase [Myxococcota bacterium]
MNAVPTHHQTTVEGLTLHHREVGSGPPILMIHGWPTSSALWRNILPIVGRTHRAIAIDLPGFGQSSKPLDASYSFRFFDRILDGFLEQLGIEEVGLVVHDLGGPVGLHWAVQRLERIRKLALMNTLVYPDLSFAVMAFIAAARLPLVRNLLTSAWGLEQALYLGVTDRRRLAPDAAASFVAPFRNRADRRALAKAAVGLHPGGLKTIALRLPEFKGPVRILYGANDRILPEFPTKTLAQLRRDLPQAEVTELEDCGHFLQEERPKDIGTLLHRFFDESATGEEC